MNRGTRIVMLCALGALGGLAGVAIAGEPRVVICHRASAAARIIEVAAAALPAHLGHGDYVAQYVVDPHAGAVGDGRHFVRIVDALAAARAGRLARGELVDAACRITIVVAPGTFRGSFDALTPAAPEQFPLFIDVPQITLRGGLQMVPDADGRATAESKDEFTVTTLAPDRALKDTPLAEAMIVVVGHPDGPRADGAVIEGFAFQSDFTATGGTGVYSLRVNDLVVRGNRFEPVLTTAVTSLASRASIEHNFARGLGFNCSICLAGPGDYRITGNRLVEGGLGGIYAAAIGDVAVSAGAHPVVPVAPYLAPAVSELTAIIVNNDISRHVRQPIGFAVRIPTRGAGPVDVQQSVTAELRDNDFVRNTFGVIVDGGFPVAGSLVGVAADVALSGNLFSGSCQNDLLVAFTRHTGALGITTNPTLHNSTYRVDLGGDLDWSDAWYSHPPGFGNALFVDGAAVGTGSRVAYDPTRPCSP